MRKQRRVETLDYIQSMLRELRMMTEADKRPMLAYLISMAYLEACDERRSEHEQRTDSPPFAA
jgi:hypothetical protein